MATDIHEFEKSVNDIILKVDGNETTLYTFIKDNFSDDVTPPSVEDLKSVLNLAPVEKTMCGMVEVERVS